MKKKFVILTIIMHIVSFAIIKSFFPSKNSKGVEWDKADISHGKSIYFANCAYCHSEKGNGKNWIGSFIEPHPRNFTDKEEMSKVDRERMFTSILKGREGTSMPTWDGILSKNDIRDVIIFIEDEFIKKVDNS